MFVVLSARSPGSIINLSSATELNAGFDSRDGDEDVQLYIVEDGGTINLSGVESIMSPWRSQDQIEITASNHSLIDLSSVQEMRAIGQSGQGTLTLNAFGSAADPAAASVIRLGPLEKVSHTLFDVSGASSSIRTNGSAEPSGRYSSTRFAQGLGSDPITIMRVTGKKR